MTSPASPPTERALAPVSASGAAKPPLTSSGQAAPTQPKCRHCGDTGYIYSGCFPEPCGCGQALIHSGSTSMEIALYTFSLDKKDIQK